MFGFVVWTGSSLVVGALGSQCKHNNKKPAILRHSRVRHSAQQKNLRHKGRRKKNIKINKKMIDKRGCDEDGKFEERKCLSSILSLDRKFKKLIRSKNTFKVFTCVQTEINFRTALGKGDFRAGAVRRRPPSHVTRLTCRSIIFFKGILSRE
jgi:hypothetical protein